MYSCVLSVLFAKEVPFLPLKIAGIVCGVTGVVLFAMASITMKNSWRVGILMFFNIPLVLVSMWAAVMLHLQILQEEQHMLNMFGGEYEEYMKHTLRYFGRR